LLRAQRHTTGSVRFDRRRRTWNYLYYDGATRRSKLIGTKQDYPTKAAAWKAVARLQLGKPNTHIGDTVRKVIARYEEERMPSRHSTARVYRSFINNHILPTWGHAYPGHPTPSGRTVAPQLIAIAKVQNSCSQPPTFCCGVCDVVRSTGHQP
jgi:hypothetical protein